jgi:hypothetical protein
MRASHLLSLVLCACACVCALAADQPDEPRSLHAADQPDEPRSLHAAGQPDEPRSLHAAGQPEPPDPQALLAAYRAVFRVRGGAEIVGPGPTTAYAADRLRVLLGGQGPLDLAPARALAQPELLRLLFLAVAGDYVTGPAALQPALCRLEADPITGTLAVTSARPDAEAALTVIAVVLLLVVVMTTYRRESAQK